MRKSKRNCEGENQRPTQKSFKKSKNKMCMCDCHLSLSFTENVKAKRNCEGERDDSHCYHSPLFTASSSQSPITASSSQPAPQPASQPSLQPTISALRTNKPHNPQPKTHSPSYERNSERFFFITPPGDVLNCEP